MLLMAGIRERDKRRRLAFLLRFRLGNFVPRLFSVRNMFFSRKLPKVEFSEWRITAVVGSAGRKALTIP